MKIIIWGTGRYYNRIKESILYENEVRIVDSDESKWGKEIDGHEIMSPETIDRNWCHYLIVAVKNCGEIIKKLDDMAFPKQQIMLFNDAVDYFMGMPSIHKGGKTISWEEWFQKSRKKKIVLMVHELSHTGVPIVIMRTALLFKEMGYDALIWSDSGGTLEKNLQQDYLEYVIGFHCCVQNNVHLNHLDGVDLFLVGTISMTNAINYLSYTRRPIILWSHESEERAFKMYQRPTYPLVKFAAVSDRTRYAMKSWWGLEEKDIVDLNYFIENDEVDHSENETLLIAVVGSVCKRKGQDILGKAWNNVDETKRNNCRIVIVGPTPHKEYLDELKRDYPDLEVLGEVSDEELKRLYTEIDLLICPSRDDPMPSVVTQAFQQEIPVIVSTETGQSKYISNGKNGFIFESDNELELTKTIEAALDDMTRLKEIGKQGKLIYESRFSKRSTKEQLINLIDEVWKPFNDVIDKIAIYCYYDKEGIVTEIAKTQMLNLKRNVDYLIIVSNGPVDFQARTVMSEIADCYIERDNMGYDAGAYAEAICSKKCKDFILNSRNLILCNNSFYGPFSGFESIFEQANLDDTDFWGLSSREYDYNPHIQSFFIMFKEKVVVSGILQNYFQKHVLNKKLNYEEVCAIFENGLSWELLSNGFKMGALAKKCDCEPYSNPIGYMDICSVPILKKKVFSKEFFDRQKTYEILAYIRARYNVYIESLIHDINRQYNLDIKEEDIPRCSHPFIITDSGTVSRQEILKFIEDNDGVYIYGFGKVAKSIYSFFFFYPQNSKLKGFIVSDSENIEESEYQGYHIYKWLEVCDENPAMLICANRKNSEEIHRNIGSNANVCYLWR